MLPVPLPYSRQLMLDRMQAADPAYDGRFVTGVLSTGIYCLPSCRARKPLPRNVEFFESMAAAREAGLRSCLRCRPDEFGSGTDSAEETLRRLQATDPATVGSASALATHLGLSRKVLADLLGRELNLTPARWLSRQRIRQAQALLLGGDDSVTQIAFAAGFGSLSAFNAGFRRHVFMTPLAFRELRDAQAFTLLLPAGYPAAAVLADLGRDPHGTTCRVSDHTCTAALRIGEQPVLATVQFRDHAADIILSRPADPQTIHHALLRLLGLTTPTQGFAALTRTRPELARLTRGREGLGLPLSATLFDGVVWAVIGQQIGFRTTCALRRRLYERVGEALPGSLYAPLTPAQVTALSPDELTATGLTRRRARTLHDLACRVAAGDLNLEALAQGPLTTRHRALLAVPGLGPWSAGYVLLRAYGAADILLAADSALATALQRLYALPERPTPQEVTALMQPFAPYRSLATLHLWHSLHAPPETP